jgi:hypothetical protein
MSSLRTPKYIESKINSPSDVCHAHSMEHEIKSTNKRGHLPKTLTRLLKKIEFPHTAVLRVPDITIILPF